MYCGFRISTLTYLFVKDVLPESLQGFGSYVILFHDKPLFNRSVRLLSHSPLMVTASLRVGLQALVQAVPLPHLLKSKGPEATLSINGPVYIYLQMARDSREQLHIFK